MAQSESEHNPAFLLLSSFVCQWAIWPYINRTSATHLHVGGNLAQDGNHGDVGLAGARGRTHQDVLVAVEGRAVNAALDAVQGPAVDEHVSSAARQAQLGAVMHSMVVYHGEQYTGPTRHR